MDTSLKKFLTDGCFSYQRSGFWWNKNYVIHIVLLWYYILCVGNLQKYNFAVFSPDTSHGKWHFVCHSIMLPLKNFSFSNIKLDFMLILYALRYKLHVMMYAIFKVLLSCGNGLKLASNNFATLILYVKLSKLFKKTTCNLLSLIPITSLSVSISCGYFVMYVNQDLLSSYIMYKFLCIYQLNISVLPGLSLCCPLFTNNS